MAPVAPASALLMTKPLPAASSRPSGVLGALDVRGSRSDAAPLADGSYTFAPTFRPAPRVVLKQRRRLPADGPGSVSDALSGQAGAREAVKASKVHRILSTVDATASAWAEAANAPESPVIVRGGITTSLPTSGRRRRARRDLSRAPGEVTHTVFEKPQVEVSAIDPAPVPLAFEDFRAPGWHQQVDIRRALDRVSDTLALARSARDFRLF